jgi:serine/threonine-protein kinase Chk2
VPQNGSSNETSKSIEASTSRPPYYYLFLTQSLLSQGNASAGDDDSDTKKPRRSQRLSVGESTPVSKKQQLPSPLTAQESTASESSTASQAFKEGTATPPEGRPSQIQHRTPEPSPSQRPKLASPIGDTQPYSQFVNQKGGLIDDEDEENEGIWGYLLPLNEKYGKSLVLRKRTACPLPGGMENFGKDRGRREVNEQKNFEAEEEAYEDTKLKGIASGGYLIGRHPECGMFISLATVRITEFGRYRDRRSYRFQQALPYIHREQER